MAPTSAPPSGLSNVCLPQLPPLLLGTWPVEQFMFCVVGGGTVPPLDPIAPS